MKTKEIVGWVGLVFAVVLLFSGLRIDTAELKDPNNYSAEEDPFNTPVTDWHKHELLLQTAKTTSGARYLAQYSSHLDVEVVETTQRTLRSLEDRETRDTADNPPAL